MTFQDKWQNEAYKECCEERSRKFAIKLTEDGISPEKVAQYIEKPVGWVNELISQLIGGVLIEAELLKSATNLIKYGMTAQEAAKKLEFTTEQAIYLAEKHSMNHFMRRWYWEGYIKGMEQAYGEKAVRDAINMLNADDSPESVSAFTDIPFEKLKHLSLAHSYE